MLVRCALPTPPSGSFEAGSFPEPDVCSFLAAWKLASPSDASVSPCLETGVTGLHWTVGFLGR